MLRHSLFALSLLIAVLLGPAGARAQLERAGGETLSVDGVVVNSETGEPIRGALVQGFAGKQVAVLTGADGKFHLEKVPGKQITLTASKPGYFSEHELSNIPAITSFTIGPDSAPVVLPLHPEGVIFGRVTDEDGEPAFLPVKVLAFRVVNGRRQKEQVFSGFTNDEGEFRVANLRSGLYYLAAGPSQSSVKKRDANGQLREMGASGEFYPGVGDFAGATPIHVASGASIRADMALSGQPFYEISGVVSGYPAGSFASLQLLDTSGEQLAQGYEFDSKTGAFQIHAPGGIYMLKATAQDAAGRPLSASQRVRVQADTTAVHLRLIAAVDLIVHIRHEAGGSQDLPQPALASLSLIPADGSPESGPPAGSVVPPGQNSATLQNVLPGSYAVELNPVMPWYVESARCGSTDLLRDNLVVTSGAPNCAIEIELRGDSATLAANIVGDSLPSAAYLLLMPENGATRTETLYTQPNAALETPGLPPGRYRVMAVDRLDELEYTNREAMEPLLAKAQEITLQARKKTPVTLELIRRKL